MVVEGTRILVIILIDLIIMSCVLSCICNILEQFVAKAWVMQKEKGGIVVGIVAEKGHNILLGASMHSPVYGWKNDDIELCLNGICEKVQ